MQDDIDSLIMTALVFGLVSMTFYFLVLKPIIPTTPQNGGIGVAMQNRAGGIGAAAAPRQVGGGQYEQGVARGRGVRSDDNSNHNNIADAILSKCAGYPYHLAPSSQSQSNIGGSNLLVDGMVAFRHCRAAGYEASLSVDLSIVSATRKERARILSRLLNLEETVAGNNSSGGSGSMTTAAAATSSSSATTAPTSLASSPPSRGSTLVISIPHDDATCCKLRRIIYLLATYYNLLLIIAVPSSYKMENFKEIIAQLREDKNGEEKSGTCSKNGYLLVKDILPDHRIIASSTVSGRIAFVRQVGRTELVLDHDPEVKSQLNRFGYRVIHYGKHKKKGDTEKVADSNAISLLACDLT